MLAGQEREHGLINVLLQEHENLKEIITQLEALCVLWDDVKVIQVIR